MCLEIILSMSASFVAKHYDICLIAHQNNTLLYSKPYKCFNSWFLIDILFTLTVKIMIKGFKKNDILKQQP